MDINNGDNKLELLFIKYGLSNAEKEELLMIIKPIYSSYEFQKRLTDMYPHHGKTTLGDHILGVAINTYLISKKYMIKKKDNNFRIDIAVKIAMLHDLYVYPWQNSKSHNKFFNKHGFRHPIEGVIDAVNWYPELFTNDIEAKKIIDGIIHHMYPLPVRVFSDNEKNILELNNFNLVSNMSTQLINILKDSSKRKRIGKISLSRSIYMEGRIVSKADKRVSFKQIDNISSMMALVTGHNKKLLKGNSKK